MLLSFGNEWKEDVLERIIIVGLIMGLIPITTLFFMLDKDSLVAQEEAQKQVQDSEQMVGVVEAGDQSTSGETPQTIQKEDGEGDEKETLQRHRAHHHLAETEDPDEDSDPLLAKPAQHSHDLSSETSSRWGLRWGLRYL